MEMSASDVVKLLKLNPLEGEGGYFLRTFESWSKISVDGRERHLQTAIYYLLTRTNFSVLHKLKSDEVFHHYLGGEVELAKITASGQSSIIKLGAKLDVGYRPQCVVEKGVWQGLRIAEESGLNWALLGTTVSPGFEFEDFELGERSQLIQEYSHLKDLIEKYTL